MIIEEKTFLDKILIIAELSANHNQNIELAKETIYAASESGADAVKLQTYTPDTMTLNSTRAEFLNATKGTIWESVSLYELYKNAYTPWEWHKDLKDLSESLGMEFFSTPFDKTAVDFLEKLNVKRYKIASFEITDVGLIEYAAKKKKPMIISTGIADAGDIQRAVDTCRKVGNSDITLLQCISSYPAPIESANLRMIKSLDETFGVKSGLSDHTIGSTVAVCAAVLGATIIEKHFILNRSIGGPDSSFSMEPSEFRDMVDNIRIAENCLGKIDYSLTDSKQNGRKFARSLYIVQDMKKGEVFNETNIRSIRPSNGLHPKYFSEVKGKVAAEDILCGTPLSWDLILPSNTDINKNKKLE